MKRFTLALSTMTLLSAVFGVVARPEPAVAAAAAPALSDAEPAPAMAAAGLCGMTQAEVQSIVDDYDLDPEAGWAQAALQQPFDCGAYDELCDILGVQGAHAYACDVWTGLEDRDTIKAISLKSVDWMAAQGLRCPPDREACEAKCDDQGKPVRNCLGTISPIDGSCLTVAYCTSLWDVVGFGRFLRPAM